MHGLAGTVRARLAVVLLAALACSRTPPPPPPAPAPVVEAPAPAPPKPRRPPPPARSVATIVDTLFILTNRERTRANLTPLRRSAELSRAAELQAEQMAAAAHFCRALRQRGVSPERMLIDAKRVIEQAIDGDDVLVAERAVESCIRHYYRAD